MDSEKRVAGLRGAPPFWWREEHVVTATGTWSIGTTTCYGANQLLLNGTFTGGCGSELKVTQDGNVFTVDSTGVWFDWVNGGWKNLNTTTTP